MASMMHQADPHAVQIFVDGSCYPNEGNLDTPGSSCIRITRPSTEFCFRDSKRAPSPGWSFRLHRRHEVGKRRDNEPAVQQSTNI